MITAHKLQILGNLCYWLYFEIKSCILKLKGLLFLIRDVQTSLDFKEVQIQIWSLQEHPSLEMPKSKSF